MRTPRPALHASVFAELFWFSRIQPLFECRHGFLGISLRCKSARTEAPPLVKQRLGRFQRVITLPPSASKHAKPRRLPHAVRLIAPGAIRLARADGPTRRSAGRIGCNEENRNQRCKRMA